MKNKIILYVVFFMTMTLTAQIKKIRGTVTDFDGAPFLGVTVAIEKTNVVVLTNFGSHVKVGD